MEVFDNLVDMFEKSTKKHASRPLFGVKKSGVYEWITYGEIAKKVEEFRSGLAALGVTEGDRVAIISDNSPEWAVAAYATYGLGAQFVPMYEAQLAQDWEFILRDCGAKALIVANSTIAESCRPMLAGNDGIETLKTLIEVGSSAEDGFDAVLAKGREKIVEPVKISPDSVAGLIYTSGTTGAPKGVMLTHNNFTSNVNAVHEIFPMSAEDVSLSFLPWAHSFGQTAELHALLSYGCAMGLAESVATILDNLQEVRPTLLFSVPRIFNRVYDSVNKTIAEGSALKKFLFNQTIETAKRRRDLQSLGKTELLNDLKFKVLDNLVAKKVRARLGGRLKYAFSGGAALSKDVGEFIDNLGIMVYEGYGLTETSPIVSANSPLGRKIGSVGRPLPGVEVKIVPVDVAPEGQGEVVVYGPNVMKGYYNLDDETAEAFDESGGFRTGDMGRIDADGFLYITGRVKEQYKLENGRYVAPAPLEEKLRLSPYIANIMIDGTNRPFNVAVIVPDFEALEGFAKSKGLSFSSQKELGDKPEIQALIAEELKKFGAEFRGYERPQKFILTDEDFTLENNMLTPSLKVKRRVVLAKYGDALSSLYGDKA